VHTVRRDRYLRHDDGEHFSSPSSFVRTLRSRRSDKLNRIGNISPEPQGNLPRHPLVAAETDEDRYTMSIE
jgi:hypothetical protein